MIKMILLFICIVLALFGLCELIHAIRLLVISPKNRALTVSVVCIENDNAEQQLLYAVDQSLWLGQKYADKVIAFDTGISANELKSCEYIANKYNAVICNSNNINDVINSIYLDKKNCSKN